MSIPIDANALAQAVGQGMYSKDTAAKWLGIQLLEIAPNFARMSMVVKPEFLNGHNICHGGLMFTLADTAFAYACNSGNISTVASGCSIEFLKPVSVGDVLTATARVVLQSGRHGVYDIEVKNSANETVVLFRGKSAQIKGNVVEV